MKRNVKNSIMIGTIILMIVGIFLTMNSLKSSSTVPSMGETPPEMSNTKTPPDKPHSNNEQATGDIRSNKNSKNEKGNKNKKDFRARGDVKESSDNTPPDMNTENPPDMPNGMGSSSSLETIHYVIFGINSLIIAITLMYLILSRFNKKTFKETFQDSDKLIIGILSTVILTGGFTYLDIYLTKNYFLTNSDNIANNGGMPGNNSGNVSYSAKTEFTENTTITSGTYTSSEADENAISVTGDIDVNLSNIKVSKEGDSDGGDSTSFYGTNSAILAKDGATLTISNANIETKASGANGVFSYGGSATTNNSNSDGTTVNINDSVITTTGNNSGGIMTTGGGVMNATNLTITTSGTSSAAIRSDRGGGKVTVNKGTYKTTGVGSPSIYSTADITVNDAKLISTASEGVVIEGANSVTLNNCDLNDDNTKLNGQSTTYKNIFLYQSMSGDAKSGNSVFTATNSKITTNNGDSFYVTNTSATINLENNTIVNNDKSGNFLRIKADSWGNSGSNGGDVVMNLTNQKVSGNIVVDNISTLNLTLKDNSYLEGMINNDNSAKEINLVIDSTSTVFLTGDSYVTTLVDADTSYSNINFNGYKLYVNGTAIN